MAEFNSCASLIKDKSKVEEILKQYEESTDPLQDILDMQNKLQTTLAEKLPEFNIKPADVETKGQLVDWVDRNFDALSDEFRELKNSIGGMSKGEKAASSVWKKWKSDHGTVIQEKLENMSDDDRMEMLMEVIDMLHFYINIVLATGMSSQDMYLLYFLKNFENTRRYNSGY